MAQDNKMYRFVCPNGHSVGDTSDRNKSARLYCEKCGEMLKCVGLDDGRRAYASDVARAKGRKK